MIPGETATGKHGVFVRNYLSGFAEALTSACGYKWALSSIEAGELEPEEEDSVTFYASVEGDLCGSISIRMPKPDAITVASSMLQEDPGDYGEMESATLHELLQVAGERFRPERNSSYKNLRFNITEEFTDKEFVSAYTGSISDEGSKVATITVLLGQDIYSVLSPVRMGEDADEEERSHSLPAVTSERPRLEGINLDLVMDVELNVTLRFGKRQLPLREVLELNTGSVLELDRQVDEPVELILDGVVIAKGEAVVVDGNYGLRVTEVAQPVSAAMLHKTVAHVEEKIPNTREN